jgi:hypothetical protein
VLEPFRASPTLQDNARYPVIRTSRQGALRLSALARAALCLAILLVIHLSELQRYVDHEVTAQAIDLLINLDHFLWI